jgi:hypothetical protein
MTLLFLRGEFSLANMRLKEYSSGKYFLIACIHVASATDINPTKLVMGAMYRMLLYKALRLSLDKLNGKGHTIDQQEFFETFLATAFFRIPEFRTRLIECLPQPTDERIEEWKQSSLSMGDDQNKGLAMQSLFNWQEEFYACLPNVNPQSPVPNSYRRTRTRQRPKGTSRPP